MAWFVLPDKNKSYVCRMDPYLLHSLLARFKFLSFTPLHLNSGKAIFFFNNLEVRSSAYTIGRYEYFHDYGRQKRKHLELHQVNDFFAWFNLTLFFQKWPRPGSKSLTQFVSGNSDLICLEVSDCRENIEAVHFIMAQCTRYPWPSPTSVNKFSLLYQTLIHI